MNKQFKLSALVVAIGAFMAVPSAFANTNSASAIVKSHQSQQGAVTSDGTSNTAGPGTYTGYNAKGNINLNNSAGTTNVQNNTLSIARASGGSHTSTSSFAGVFGDQCLATFCFDAVVLNQVTNSAYLSDNSFEYGSGNIGANIASGEQNLQVNNAAIASGSGSVGHVDHDHNHNERNHDQNDSNAIAMVFAHQYANNNVSSYGTHNTTWVGNNVLRGATGNAGVNVASGAQNMQANDVAISRNKNGTDSFSVAKVEQVSMGSITATQPCGQPWIAPQNTATIGNNLMRGASGNLGVNVAAGYGNLQNNTLTISNSNAQ